MQETEKETKKITSCYTYEVDMIIQILATTREEAYEKLDREGGFISKREVVLKDAVSLYSGEEETKDADK